MANIRDNNDNEAPFKGLPVMNPSLYVCGELNNTMYQQKHSISCIISGLSSSSSKTRWNSSRPYLLTKSAAEQKSSSTSVQPTLNDSGKVIHKQNINCATSCIKPNLITRKFDWYERSVARDANNNKNNSSSSNNTINNNVLNNMKNNNISKMLSQQLDHIAISGKNSFSKKTTSPSLRDLKDDRYAHRKVPLIYESCDLSVVSSAAPMQLRLEASVDDSIKHHLSLNHVTNLNRSTRAQRVRGASNTIRLKQLELLENRSVEPS